jgi:hypothetical protein
MRLAGIVLGTLLSASPAMAQFVDREAIFERARNIATVTLPGVLGADLVPFHIAYGLTLLETGDPAGSIEVDLLIRSSREVLPAREVIAAAPDPDAAARLESLLAGVEYAWHYRTVRVRFPEQGDAAPAAEFSTLLLNRDPEAGVSSAETTKP